MKKIARSLSDISDQLRIQNALLQKLIQNDGEKKKDKNDMKERDFIFIMVLFNIIGLISSVVVSCALLKLGNPYKSLFGGVLIGWTSATAIWEILELIANK